MKHKISIIVFLTLLSLSSWAQIGGDYNPTNPSDPGTPVLKYQLSLIAEPMNSGSFNFSNERLAVGSTNSLRAYTNTDFVFKHWVIGDSILSTSPNLDFVMPAHNVQIIGQFEYNPTNPANPNRNYWNKELGEIIVDDFTPGSLNSAVSSVISGSNSSDVAMITVAGKMNDNDFGIANNYSNCKLLDLSRVTGITQIPSYAFDYTNLESVYLPATIEKIGYRAFYDCKQLLSLTVYAMTPPELDNYVFTGVQEGLVVYVPAAAIAQYQDTDGWKDFTLLPIQEDIRSISVSLPEGTNAADYAQMWLELTNTKSGQKMHYVMTDRTSYTFANIIRNTSWNVVLRNQRGDVFGRIENIDVKDENVSVAFTSLAKPQNVSLAVVTPEGTDVTAQTQVTWTDEAGNYLAQAYSFNGLLPETKVGYRVVLSQELAMQYATPTLTAYTVSASGNEVKYQLAAIQQVQLTGKVKDLATKTALSGAVVSASQTFGGKYSKTTSTKTDANGNYTLAISYVPTSLAIAATDHISHTIVCDTLLTGTETVTVPEVSLKAITGAIISLGFTYTSSAAEDEDANFQEWYSDYNNIAYTIYNKTKQQAISQFNVQYPQIVLLEEVEEGDVLELTATSKTSAFMPVKTTTTIDAEQRANATFDIVELGKIQASFTKNGNATVVGSLYNANGKLLKSYDYNNASLTISNLADGNYTLVSMGSSKLFNTIYDLSQLPQTGLVLGSDYTQNAVEVKSGVISVVSIEEVPTLDESKLYYTGDNTSFTVNKSSIVVGNYLTLTGHLDFKPAYATSVSNVDLIVDLPESCSFVENSVMVGNNTSSYTLNGTRLTIPMARYTDRVRFCVIPTLGGEYAPSAFVQFDLNGEAVTQPIGSANYTAKDLSITVPSIVAKTAVPISGTAIGISSVEIYDNEVLIGQTTSLANGTWATTCNLNEPYNLSRHQIYAKVTTKQGIELISENVSCTYDMNAIQVSVVKMYHDNPEMNKTYELTFDFLNPSNKEENYIYYIYNKKFTFTIDFTNNDTTKVSDVVLYVKTVKSGWHPLEATYDAKQDLWVAAGEFGNTYDLPVNVSVDFTASTEALASSSMLQDMRKDATDGYDEYIQGKNDIRQTISNALDAIHQAGDNVEELQKAYQVVEQTISNINKQYGLSMDLDSVSEYDSLSEEELEATEEQDSIRMLALLKEVNTEMEKFDSFYVYQDFFDFFDDNTGAAIKSTTCEGLKAEQLLTEGYEIVITDRGDSIYAKICNDTISYVCFKENICQTIVLEKLDESIEHISKMKKIISKEELEIISEQMMQLLTEIKTAKGRVDKLLATLGKVTISTIQNDYQEMLYSSTELASALTNLAGMVSEFVGKTQDKIFKPIQSLQNKYNKLHHECALAKAHAAKTKNINKHLFWKSIAIQLEEQMAPMKFILNQKWVVNVGKFIGKYAPVANVVFTTATAAEKIGVVVATASTIFPCQDDMYNACRAMVYAIDMIKNVGEYVAASLGVETALDASAIATSETIIGTVLCVTLKFIASWGVDKGTSWHFNNKVKALEKMIMNLKCYQPCKNGKCPDNDDNKRNNGGNHKSNNKDKGVSIDPSGYVYEGVNTNRIEGVTATIYYKEDVEDMYGDFHENIVKWDAEEYAQENPLFTDENGYYRWDVPQGLWQVKFEKEGYETTYSEWLPVPPPQLEVNIAMKQNVQPNVQNARAYEDAVEVEFDKYMTPELLNTENIMVMADGKNVEGMIELLNEEVSNEGETETFASKIRFNAAEPFDATEVTLTVSNRVKSYAGIRMQDNFSQTFTVEQEVRKIVCDSVAVVGYGDARTLMVTVLPASASAGKTLKVHTSSSMILSTAIESVVLDEDGKAKIPVTGELPGTAAVTFTVDGYDLSRTTIVNVEQIEYKTVATPTANIAFGTTVEKGTEITLSCATEGATIYYTLDGSCPCDNTAARKIYDSTPIVINENTTIKAMAVTPNMYESDVAEFTYIVDENETDIDNVTINEEIEIYPLPVHEKMNVTANGKIVKSVTVSAMNGVLVASSTKAATKVTIDVSKIPTGIYIINVTTESGIFSRKILKIQQ